MLNALWEIIEHHQIPTQNCVLAHVTTQMEAIRQGANAGMIFQSIAGSEKGLREFGVTTGLLDEAYDLARHYCQATGPNVMYFETGQGSALSAGAHFGVDQQTLECRAYAVARRYRPLLVNTVVGFIGPEYLFNGKQIIRAGLEDHCCGKLLGLPMGYVRSGNKDHGRQNQIEGRLEPGQKVVVIEDLISTGGSVLDVVSVLREAGAEVLGVASIFTYGMQKGLDRLAAANVKNHSLTNFDVIADVAAKQNYIHPEDVARLIQFRNDPSDESWIGGKN